MRDAAIRVIRAIGVETGGSNIQFALNPRDGRMLVIEMNPRVSRSSALASKATGFPIAKIAARLAVGYTLDEIPNDITKMTPSCFEPTIDYCVVKIPRWDFEMFKGLEAASSLLGVQMKSVGEAMAFGRTFKEALQKALRSLEQGRYGFGADGKDEFDLTDNEDGHILATIRERLPQRRSDMIFNIRYALQLGLSVEAIYEATKIDPWFLDQLWQIVQTENELREAARMQREPRRQRQTAEMAS
jgi:carbamoyl-phosphate synthase large subunit